MHVKLTNGQPEKYSIGQLRRDNPRVSFPRIIPDATLAEYGVYHLKPVDRPLVDYTKNTIEGAPAQINGIWTQVWEITDATAGEIEARTQEKAQSVRIQRDALLASTDWLVIKAQEIGASITTEWATYRQALRDITAQEGFPHSVNWPAKP